MTYETRKPLIQRIEAVRKKPLLTYVTTLRPNISAPIEGWDLRVLQAHLSKTPKGPVDLFLITYGGDATLPWAIANYIRSTKDGYSVLVPSFAASAGTSIALGADEIVMGPAGLLSPVDPQVMNEFNPDAEGQGRKIPISVEDIGGFEKLLTDKFQFKDERNIASLVDRLAADVRPLALGNAYRHYVKAREDTRKLLTLHMNPGEKKKVIEEATKTLVETLYFHGHHVVREEAKKIGLDVVEAETIPAAGDGTLADLMWKLFLDYEGDLQFMEPYYDQQPLLGPGQAAETRVLTKYIESSSHSSAYGIRQFWRRLPFPAGSVPIQIPTEDALLPGIFIPPDKIQVVAATGFLIPVNDGWIEKGELGSWSNVTPP